MMWLRSVLAATAVLSLPTFAAPVGNGNAVNGSSDGSAATRIDYDAIIVGGGPAGLSALSGLARVRRNVLLVDSGEYRNAATRHLHDVIGNDGQTGAYYRWTARKSLGNYGTVTMTNGTVTSIQPQQNSTFFTVTGNYTGGHEIAYTARKVILATGVRDVIPGTPGLRENFGKGIYWCPWCDGHEHADQQLGAVGPVTSLPGTVSEVSTLNRDIVAFTNGTAANQTLVDATEKDFPRWRDYLAAKQVPVDDRVMTRVERLRDGADPSADPSLPSYPEHDLFRLHFATGESVLRDALVLHVKTEQASTLPGQVGTALDKGGKIDVDGSRGLSTSVEGVFAVGDANNDGATNIPHALFSGKRAAVYVHVQLEKEKTAASLYSASGSTSKYLGSRSIPQEVEVRAAWDQVNGQPGDLLYAGEFDQ